MQLPDTFTQLQRRYTALRERFLSGLVSDEDFSRACSRLELTDKQGRRWRIEPYSGAWLRLDDGQWRHAVPAFSEQAGDPLAETSLRLAFGRHVGGWNPGTDDGELPPDSGIDAAFLGIHKGRILGGGE